MMTIRFEHGMHSLGMPVFLRPAISDPEWNRGTPCDIEKAAADLVDAIIGAGWNVPGFDIALSTSQERDGRLFRRVSEISGETDEGCFALHFYGGARPSGFDTTLPTGVSHIVIPPGIDIMYFNDGSGPRAKVYNTSDWKGDGKRLRGINDVNAAMRREERASITYNRRDGDILHPTGDGRDFQPASEEAPFLDLEEIKGKIVRFIGGLTERVLALPPGLFRGVESPHGHGDAALFQLAHVAKIPVPNDFPVLHTFVEPREAEQIIPLNENNPPFRVISPDSNWRLLPLSVHTGDDIHNRSFQFCSAGGWSRDLHQSFTIDERALPVLVELKYANDVYVVDRSLQEKARDRVWRKAEAEGRKELTQLEVAEIRTAVARSFVPLSNYRGGYETPRYLIGRQLKDDEARLVQGAVTLEETAESSRAYVTDRVSGEQVDLYTSSRPIRWRHPEARRIAEDFAFFLDDGSRQYDVVSDAPTPEPPSDITEFLSPRA